MLFFLHFIKISWWCITILASLFMNLIVIVSISSFYNGFNLRIIKEYTLKVWLVSIYSYILGAFYLIITSLIFHNAEYYEGDNIFKLIESGIYLANNHSFYSNSFSIMFIASGILVSSITSFLLNFTFSFTMNIALKRKTIICILLSIFTAPYSFLLLEKWPAP